MYHGGINYCERIDFINCAAFFLSPELVLVVAKTRLVLSPSRCVLI